MARTTPWEAIKAALDLSIRAMDDVRALAVRPGVPGRDGIGFDDIEEKFEDGGRILVRRFLRDGELVKETRLQTAMPLDRGVYDPARRYVAGDGVTFGGQWHLAQRDTMGEKPMESDAWRLAVKSGRAGRDGKDGVLKPPPGPVKIGGK